MASQSDLVLLCRVQTAVHFFHDFLRILAEDGLQLALANPSKQASI